MRRPFQFSLRTTFFSVLCCGVLLAGWELTRVWQFTHFWQLIVSLIFLSFLIGRRFRIPRTQCIQLLCLRRCGLILSVIFLFTALWLRHRWLISLDDGSWPHAWPYPDILLDYYYKWLDSRNPPRPGFIKMCGEFNTVYEHLTRLAISAACLNGFALGFADLKKSIPA